MRAVLDLPRWWSNPAAPNDGERGSAAERRAPAKVLYSNVGEGAPNVIPRSQGGSYWMTRSGRMTWPVPEPKRQRREIPNVLPILMLIYPSTSPELAQTRNLRCDGHCAANPRGRHPRARVGRSCRHRPHPAVGGRAPLGMMIVGLWLTASRIPANRDVAIRLAGWTAMMALGMTLPQRDRDIVESHPGFPERSAGGQAPAVRRHGSGPGIPASANVAPAARAEAFRAGAECALATTSCDQVARESR